MDVHHARGHRDRLNDVAAVPGTIEDPTEAPGVGPGDVPGADDVPGLHAWPMAALQEDLPPVSFSRGGALHRPRLAPTGALSRGVARRPPPAVVGRCAGDPRRGLAVMEPQRRSTTPYSCVETSRLIWSSREPHGGWAVR